MKSYMGGFRELEAWKAGREFKRMISRIAKNFPAEEKFSLTVQIRRSSRSVTANIAEGYGRYHYKETMQFFRHSRGSLYETLDHLISALDEGYLDEETYAEAEECFNRTLKLINGYISYLERSANQLPSPNTPIPQYPNTPKP